MRPRALIALLAAVAVGLVLPTSSAAAGQRTRVVAHCTDVSFEPTHYIFYCADGGAGLRHAVYDKWASDVARGSGTYWFNDCDPSCAGGTFHHRAATFRLYRVVDTEKRGPLFTRIKVSTKKHDYVFQLTTRPY